MLLGCAAGRCPATTILGLSLYRSHATDLENPKIRRSRRWFGRQSHRRHAFAASTSAAPATCCTVSASQFPIESAEPAAPIPRLPSLAAFERRPRCAWQRSRWAGIRNPSQSRTSHRLRGSLHNAVQRKRNKSRRPHIPDSLVRPSHIALIIARNEQILRTHPGFSRIAVISLRPQPSMEPAQAAHFACRAKVSST